MNEEEKISYYFNQYWAFHNPMMLRMDDLTDKMEEIFAEEWRKIPDCIETKTMMVGKNFKLRILGKKC